MTETKPAWLSKQDAKYDRAMKKPALTKPWEELKLGCPYLLIDADGYQVEMMYLKKESESGWKHFMGAYGGADNVKVYQLPRIRLPAWLFGDKDHQKAMGWVA